MAQICNAKSKSTGEQCKQPVVKGSTKCRFHGGKSLKGLASPRFTNGERSKYLPASMLGAYEDARSDETLLSVRKDIHLIDTLILAKLGKLGTGESAEHWDELLKQIIAARKAYKSENYGALEAALDEMEALTDQRRLHYATEQEITAQLDQRRKMVETEQKITTQGERAITAEQAMLLISALLDSVRRNVTDATALTYIQADFIRLVGSRNSQPVIIATTETAD